MKDLKKLHVFCAIFAVALIFGALLCEQGAKTQNGYVNGLYDGRGENRTFVKSSKAPGHSTVKHKAITPKEKTNSAAR